MRYSRHDGRDPWIVATWVVVIGIVGTLITLLVLSIKQDMDAKDACRAKEGLVAETEHGDGWICMGSDGRVIR